MIALGGCGGAGGGDPEWYYHFVCNGDPECLSTNFAGASSGTSNQGPGQGGRAGCNSLLHFGANVWSIPPAQQWCDNSPGLNPPPTPAVTLTLTPSAIDAGQTATLTWSSTLVTSCTAGRSWSGAKGTSGSEQVAPATPGSYTYALSCTGPGGSASGSATLTVRLPPPSVQLAVSPATITVGQQATLAWTTWQYTSCAGSGPWSGPVALNGSQSVSPPAAGTYTYTLSCLSALKGSGSGSATLTVLPASGPAPAPAPTVAISAATEYPSCVDTGQQTTLTWSSTGATSCTASGSWSGTVAPSGSQVIYPAAASSAAYLTLEYALSCTGAGGTASASAAVCAVPSNGWQPPPQPALDLAVTPASIALGESATLEWSSRYASACTASDAWTGLQSLSGTSTVTPPSAGTFNYSLFCQGYQGGASATVTLSVQTAPGTAPLAARFCMPLGLAVDASDALYVADTNNSTIRKITQAGVVSTVAGLAGYTGSADGPGASARFYGPAGVGVDAGGTISVADANNSTIRLIAPDGNVTTLAGAPGYLGNGTDTDGTGPLASFYRPYAAAPGADGNLYVADYGYGSIRRVTPAGVVTTIAGLARSPGSADGTGADARFLGPSGLVVLPSGDIYVADQGNHTIRRIAPGGVVTTFAGTAGVQGAADGTGPAASFFHPFAIAVDSQGNLFVTDKDNKKIRKITPDGAVTTFAGSGAHGNTDATGTAASFYYPSGIAIDSADNLYVTDAAAIRKITPAGEVTTFAGSAGTCGTNN
ncbi:MAG: hypothetical protein HZB56_09010 [Deltaproteobacteria bacterium]|nr:hypothetical protein [Deltaproteobacteria bacterium]